MTSPFDKLQSEAEKKKITDHQVKAFMSRKAMCVTEGTRIYFAIKMLHSHRISGAPVVDKAGNLVGVISDYDLLLQAATKDVSDPLTFNKEVKFVKESATLKDVLLIFHKTKFRRLPVLNDQHKVVGVVSRIDVLSHLMGL